MLELNKVDVIVTRIWVNKSWLINMVNKELTSFEKQQNIYFMKVYDMQSLK